MRERVLQMNADEIELVIKANIDKLVRVVYADGETEKLFVHTVDDEGFVCDIATEMSEPPPCAYWMRFRNVREAQPAESGREET
jgi:hypothetical protein